MARIQLFLFYLAMAFVSLVSLRHGRRFITDGELGAKLRTVNERAQFLDRQARRVSDVGHG